MSVQFEYATELAAGVNSWKRCSSNLSDNVYAKGTIFLSAGMQGFYFKYKFLCTTDEGYLKFVHSTSSQPPYVFRPIEDMEIELQLWHVDGDDCAIDVEGYDPVRNVVIGHYVRLPLKSTMSRALLALHALYVKLGIMSGPGALLVKNGPHAGGKQIRNLFMAKHRKKACMKLVKKPAKK